VTTITGGAVDGTNITVGAGPYVSQMVFANGMSPTPVAAVPTLSQWAMILLGLALVGVSGLMFRQRGVLVA
jgi:hypothetical protein